MKNIDVNIIRKGWIWDMIKGGSCILGIFRGYGILYEYYERVGSLCVE